MDGRTQPATAASTDVETATVLLVDDRYENLLALKAILDRPDYDLVFASSGEEALAAVLRRDVAVVLMDVAMPGLDGFETADLIRRRVTRHPVPIIFVTAFMADAQFVFRGYEAGAVDYLTKPLDMAAVRAKVAVFVDLWRYRLTVPTAHFSRWSGIRPSTSRSAG